MESFLTIVSILVTFPPTELSLFTRKPTISDWELLRLRRQLETQEPGSPVESSVRHLRTISNKKKNEKKIAGILG